VHIDDQRSALASGELQPGERLLWSGRPESTRIFFAIDVFFLIPGGLLFTGIGSVAAAKVFASGHLSASGYLGAGLVSMSFVLAGIHVSFGRIYVRTWVRKRTVYAVTDRRILALIPAWRGARHPSSVWLESHPPVDKRIGRNGRGTLWVGRPTSHQDRQTEEWGWQRSGSSAVAFLDIPEADGVARLIARQLGELGEGQVSGS
jgi:hypothetical protein